MMIKGRFLYYARKLHTQYARYRLRRYRHFFDNKPGDAVPPAWHKLWNLYRRVRKVRPEVVVEFGSGCSTAILAQALHENKRGYLYTYEEDERWQQVTKSSLPNHVTNVTVFHRPKIENEFHGVHGWRYTGEIHDADFVYLDGPSLEPDRLVAFDILFMKQKPRWIVVDSRKSNCAFLKKHLPDYTYKYNPINNQSIFIKQ